MRLIVAAMLLMATTAAHAAPTETRFTPPESGVVNVAFVVSEGATLIDVAGPMQVFDQVQAPGVKFRTFTVSQTREPIKVGTITVVPDYAFADGPQADIVVVGAQSGNSRPYMDYLQQMTAREALMLSVCTGAYEFALAGILDGLDATSHHDYIERLQKRFPKVHFLTGKAWVHSGPKIYTAGGETSGIELALHIVELYFDHSVAVRTARFMEYRGPDWQR